MPGYLIYSLNEVTILIVFVVFLYGSAEIGFRFGRHTKAVRSENAHPHVATIEAALLGLLALLLGFAFSMAMDRYDARKLILVDEADDLQTAYLRAKLLPEPYRSKCTALLRQYVDSRLDYYRVESESEEARQALARTVDVQVQLWTLAVAATQENSDGVTRGFFVDTLNGLIDDHNKRIAAMEDHVPIPILRLLALMACMTIGVTGYSSGLKHHRLVGLRFVLAVLVAATLLVIVDLDRPGRGLMKISEESLVHARSQLDAFDK